MLSKNVFKIVQISNFSDTVKPIINTVEKKEDVQGIKCI